MPVEQVVHVRNLATGTIPLRTASDPGPESHTYATRRRVTLGRPRLASVEELCGWAESAAGRPCDPPFTSMTNSYLLGVYSVDPDPCEIRRSLSGSRCQTQRRSVLGVRNREDGSHVRNGSETPAYRS